MPLEFENTLGEADLRVTRPRVAVLADAGLLRQIQPPGSVARYESQSGDNHHHIVCRRCGAIAEVECGVGTAPCLEAPGDHGYLIDETEVVHRGLCPDCSKQDSSDQSPSSSPQKESRV